MAGIRASISGRGVPRPLAILQGGLLLTLALVVGTRYWQDHPLVAWGLIVVTALAWLPELRRPRLRRWWFVYVWGIFLYTVLRSYADETGIDIHLAYPIEFDREIAGGALPTAWLQRRWFSPGAVDAFDWAMVAVHWSFFVVPHAFAILVAWRRPQLFPGFTALIVGSMYLALVLFFLVPTTPPWLAAARGEIGPAYRVMDFVGGAVSGSTYQQFYEALGEPNSVAAMPSLHLGVTFALCLWAARHARGWVPVLAAYTLLMGFALVYLAEHYVADLVGGAAVAVTAWAAVFAWEKRAAASLRPLPIEAAHTPAAGATTVPRSRGTDAEPTRPSVPGPAE